MRIVLFVLVFLHCSICFSQKESNTIVEYHCFNDTDLPTSYYTILYVNKNVSIYQEKFSTITRGKLKSEDDGFVIVPGSNDFEPYLKVDRSNHEVLFFDMIGTNTFLVKDDYKSLEWTITDETKTIAGFPCVKATTNFRGREWIAWFTSEIPLSFGPWKLNGLPGLILETYDSTNKFIWKVVKVRYDKSDLFDKNFNSLMKARNTKPLSYQQFLFDEKEYSHNVFTEMSKDDPNLTSVIVPRGGKELKFEWE